MGNICITREDDPSQLAEQYQTCLALWQEVTAKLGDDITLADECSGVYRNECRRLGINQLSKRQWQEITRLFVDRLSCSDPRTRERIYAAIDRHCQGPGDRPISENDFWEFTRLALSVAERDLRDRISKMQERGPLAAPATSTRQSPPPPPSRPAGAQGSAPAWRTGAPPQPAPAAREVPWQPGATVPPGQIQAAAAAAAFSEPDLMPSQPLQLPESARRLQEEQRAQARAEQEMQRSQELQEIQRQQDAQEQRLQTLYELQQRSQQRSQPASQAALSAQQAQLQAQQRQQQQQQQEQMRLVSFEDQQGYADVVAAAAGSPAQAHRAPSFEEQAMVQRALQKNQALASSLPPAAAQPQPAPSAHLDQTVEVQGGTADDMTYTLFQPQRAPAAGQPANGAGYGGLVPQTGLPPDQVNSMKQLILAGRLPVSVFNKSIQLEQKRLALDTHAQRLSILRLTNELEDSWEVDHLHSITKGIPPSILPDPPSPDCALAFRFRFGDDGEEDRFLCVVLDSPEICLLAVEAFSQMCSVPAVSV